VQGTNVTLNHIIWLRSLHDGECGPSNRVVEDIEANGINGSLPILLKGIGTLTELEAFFDWLRDAGQKGLRPVLHIDCHGSAEDGLLLAPSGEYCDWGTLSDSLRDCNAATVNNLCCITNACFGAYLGRQFDIGRISPTHCFDWLAFGSDK
jgi:hypothetical protein